jgi:predicted ATPase/DNA-binding winged helix-turn-helix (wHTH) protein
MAPSSSTRTHSSNKNDTALSGGNRGAIAFGRYRLFPHRRQLLAGKQVIELGGRAFDVLLALIEAEGKLVTKDELLSRVWPGTVVDEHNISVHISMIRRALGEDRTLIVTDAARGYRFTGTVLAVASESGLEPALDLAQTNITAPLSALVGRETAASELSELLSARRLVTLTGPGGIGKTRLAIEVARIVLPSLPSGAWVTELAPLTDPKLVAGTIATALRVSLGSNDDIIECLKALSSGAMLIVLDNCEHVIDVVAHLAERMLRHIPSLHILATSRESLGAEGEYVYHVPPLEAPPEGLEDAKQIPQFSAVQLFSKLANAADPNFLLSDETIATAGTICRRLDGIPLAIELAAARVETLGVMEVANRLADRLLLLTGGRRTALPRHRALRATLDWSYRLLDESEQAIFRRLAIFANGFTLRSAGAVVVGEDVNHREVTDLVTSLVKKSLVTADVHRIVPRYRLLETTRAYALEKLADTGELALAARRHAVHFREVLEGMQIECAALTVPELMARYAPEIDNVRAALDWSFSPDGDLQTAVALAAASVSLWTLLSLLGECRDWTERALAHLGDTAASRRYEMLLHAALGMALMWAKGPVSATCAAWERSLSLAQELGEAEYQVRALYGLWVFHTRLANFRRALELGEQLRRVGEGAGDLSSISTADRLIGTSLHLIGHQARAQAALEAVIKPQRPKWHLHHLYVTRFGLDQRISALACQARVDWVQGFPDRAWRRALAAVEDARLLGHINSLCVGLGEGVCAVAALRGDVDAVDEFAATLIEQAEKHGNQPTRLLGTWFRGWVLINRGEVERGWGLLRSLLGSMQEGSAIVRRAHIVGSAFYYGTLPSMLRTDMIADAASLVSDVLGWLPQDDACWCTAELLRVKGEFMLTAGVAGASEMAEQHFMESLVAAKKSGARSWELRTAISLTRLWCTQNRAKEARAVLFEAYKMFDEGFDTSDLIAARTLLEKVDSVVH